MPPPGVQALPLRPFPDSVPRACITCPFTLSDFSPEVPRSAEPLETCLTGTATSRAQNAASFLQGSGHYLVPECEVGLPVLGSGALVRPDLITLP